MSSVGLSGALFLRVVTALFTVSQDEARDEIYTNLLITRTFLFSD